MKRVLAFLLAMVMLLGYFPTSAIHVHADEVEDPTEAVAEETTEPVETTVPEEPKEEETTEPVSDPTVSAPTEVISTPGGTASGAAPAAASVIASGSCGSGVSWSLNDSGVL